MLSEFAQVSLGTLIPALTPRQNTIEYVPVQKLDEIASGCFECALKNGEPNCATCLNKKYYAESKEIVYINETNRYGSRKILHKGALSLYLFIHFLFPDTNGYVRRIDIDEVAEELNCDPKTVKNNMKLLQSGDYISYSQTDIPGYYQAFITNFRDMYKDARNGGRGYVMFSREVVKRIISLHDINSMRLAIRSYISNETDSYRPSLAKEQSYKALRGHLPAYVTLKKIKTIIQDTDFLSIFNVARKKRSAAIAIKPEYSQAKLSESIKEKCKEEITAFIERVNKPLKRKRGKGKPKLLELTTKDLSDIISIGKRLPVEAIIHGLDVFYTTYIKPGISYRSAGALVRTYALDYIRDGFIPT